LAPEAANKKGIFFFVVFELLNLILIFKNFKFVGKVLRSAYEAIKYIRSYYGNGMLMKL
jgi:hypothetical protein